MEDYLSFKIGKVRKVTIYDIKKIPVTIPIKNIILDKITFFVKDHAGREFSISDVWLDKKEQKVIKGLFLATTDDNKIASGSPLGKLLTFYKKEQLKDFLNSEVSVYPDKKGYLVMLACTFEQETKNEM